MGGVYVTYVADVDKGQWHVLTLYGPLNLFEAFQAYEEDSFGNVKSCVYSRLLQTKNVGTQK